MQANSLLHNPTIEVTIAGRGTGKSNKKAWRYKEIMRTMPGSCGAIYSKTFKSLLTNTISPVLEGLERLGYHRDVHYVIGQRPPSSWPLAPNAPVRFEYYISWFNGTGWRMMSEDREDSLRGPSVDYVDADEGLLLDKSKFEQGPLMANRGNLKKFEKVPFHHGITIDSSMPVNPKGNWILDFGKYYEEDGNNYWPIWNQIIRMQYEFLQERDPVKKETLVREWLQLQSRIKFYKKTISEDPRSGKKTTVLFHFYNVFDNIKNVGLNYVHQAMRTMTPAAFRVEMLNARITSVEDCFYNIEDRHLYEAVNNSYLDSIGYDLSRIRTESDCRMDADLDMHSPIDIAIDYGHHINGMRCAQEHRSNLRGEPHWQYRYLRTFFVKPPQGIPDLIDSFCNYYRFHRTKQINLYFDSTHKGGEGWRMPHVEETIKELNKRGWRVDQQYIGKAPFHPEKHLLWFIALKEQDDRFPAIRFNRTGDKDGILSMQLAGVKNGRNGLEKDKSSERSTGIPREQATDLSDAADVLLWGKFSHLLDREQPFIPIASG